MQNLEQFKYNDELADLSCGEGNRLPEWREAMYIATGECV